MRKVTRLFFFCLVLFIGIWIGDAIDKSENTIEANDSQFPQNIQAAKTAEQYITIGELVTAIGALVTGIIAVATKPKPNNVSQNPP